MRATAGRDDYFTQIHKAIRWGLFDVAGAIGRLDVGDRDALERSAQSWSRLSALLRAHTWHEETFIYPLAESKAPLSVHLRHLEHQDLDAAVERIDGGMNRLVTTSDQPSSDDVVAVGRNLSGFIGAYLPHMLEEELTVMPLLWSTCSDDELKVCREAFMAAVGEEENLLTLELMFASLSIPELHVVVESCRMAGGETWAQLSDVAARQGNFQQRAALGLD